MKTVKTTYKCDSCGKEGEDSARFNEFYLSSPYDRGLEIGTLHLCLECSRNLPPGIEAHMRLFARPYIEAYREEQAATERSSTP